MDLDAYVTERTPEWDRLDVLSRKRRLTATEADELVVLYQRATTHLSVIRSRAPDPLVLANLSRLVLGGRATITGARRFSWEPVRYFFAAGFPGELYRTRRWWIGVTVIMVTLGGVLMQYVAGHPDVAAQFMSEAQIRQLLDEDFVGYYSEYHAQNFAAQVWTNNALLTAQCLASGVLIVPVLYLLGTNLLGVGVTGGVMIGNNSGDVFFTMIAPHGLLELTSVFVGAGVGLRIGWGWIAPGPDRTRGQALAERARSGMTVALGLVLVLAVAGLLEAYVTPSPLPAPVRITVGAVVWLAFGGYALGAGRVAHARGHSADLTEEHRGADVPTS